MEIKKVWIMTRENVDLTMYETREEAIAAATALHSHDRKSITGIYESFAGVDEEGNYEELWSEDVPEMTTSWGVRGGESLSEEELECIINNGYEIESELLEAIPEKDRGGQFSFILDSINGLMVDSGNCIHDYEEEAEELHWERQDHDFTIYDEGSTYYGICNFEDLIEFYHDGYTAVIR